MLGTMGAQSEIFDDFRVHLGVHFGSILGTCLVFFWRFFEATL